MQLEAVLKTLSLKEVKEIILKSSLVTNPKVSFLAEGHGNSNYLIEENNKKFVFRVKKSNEIQFIDSLEREYTFLSSLREPRDRILSKGFVV